MQITVNSIIMLMCNSHNKVDKVAVKQKTVKLCVIQDMVLRNAITSTC